MPTSTKNISDLHSTRLCLTLLLPLVAGNVVASPTVNGTQISWPDDGWYQVQTADGSQTLCNGGSSCDVGPGNYLVINHTTGERFNNVEVTGSNPSGVAVNGTQISWPDDGWYQVQTADGSQTLCNGGRSCDVGPGNYLVINHTSGERFNNIKVSGSGPAGITVNGTQISWPDDGWYQVQTADGSQTLCNGGSVCDVSAGEYVVINHTTGERFNNIVVGGESQSTISVDFNITVPAYMPSDELVLELNWGEMKFNASWVGDEFWIASAEFPADTENQLIVTFYDFNGGIELARYNRAYRTGSNAASVEIRANQFESDQFDEDADGVSNLDELIAGTSPIVDEDSLLDIYNYHFLNRSHRMSTLHNYEYMISDSRPLIDTIEVEPPFDNFEEAGGFTFGDIDIDTDGNGTISYGHYFPNNQIRYTGTRTHSDNSITWEGSRGAYDGDYRHGVSFSNTVSVVDENTRTFVEEVSGRNTGAFSFSWETSTDLTGTLIEGTSFCKPVAGTFSATYRTSPNIVTEYLVSKETDDLYWRVAVVSVNDQSVTVRDDEYFVRQLNFSTNNSYDFFGDEPLAPEDKYFKCDFVDF